MALAGIAVGASDPGATLIVRALGAGLRSRRRTVRITGIVSIARAVGVTGIISVAIRIAIAGINASTVRSAIDRPPVQTWGDIAAIIAGASQVSPPSVVPARARKARTAGVSVSAGVSARSITAATAAKTLTAAASRESSRGTTAPASGPAAVTLC